MLPLTVPGTIFIDSKSSAGGSVSLYSQKLLAFPSFQKSTVPFLFLNPRITVASFPSLLEDILPVILGTEEEKQNCNMQQFMFDR